MKKLILVVAVIASACLWIWFQKPWSIAPVENNLPQSQPPSLAIRNENEVLQAKSWKLLQVKAKTNAPIPPTMRGATDDPAVVELVSSYRKIEFGKVITIENGNQQFWDGTRLIFQAKKIGTRSQATDGTIALDAVTGLQTPIDEAEVTKNGNEMRLISSPREIWFISPDGAKKKVSPPNVDAFASVIAPNGKRVAFTGRQLNEKGFPSVQRLYILESETGLYQLFEDDEHLHQYQIWPVDWAQNGSILRVLQDHGETGGHMKLKQVLVD